ncbi:lysine 5,6-aminomutase subunit alpha [Natranaerobius thermophilus]|uniref:Beta-lysine 5,6-aminomutase alpha subunit, D-lysine 5,6-aminomutase alpha subunit n=1 Tax=Natranaerobius thermophilus (strain ATCC BAA-1301 / DSM 18059 / JW/NM-WN-LF) TaxID=457570 RepID=B2A664_NATTJ|nr:lysine 5,6-aminomutase subunit alpha [Natranaerobius thermophilus]ACB85477.1 beta-lysine 5,6-aminomutase alpha subunit, D-lysine 5,6-aminomutase alpha subunit [Natranaerobius thermophilus JW/NM-WN-LF]
MEAKLKVNQELVDKSRKYSQKIADGIQKHIDENTTTSVERTVARLMGIDGTDKEEIPLPNVVVEQVHKSDSLGKGIAYWIGNAMVETGKQPQEIAEAVGRGELTLTDLPQHDPDKIYQTVNELAEKTIENIRKNCEEREELMEKQSPGEQPWKYVIVATGNVYEDARQAKAAARQGADIIAVIRSTAQSLIDYVPYGKTTEGFGGTYATQENFKIMRQELDEVGEELGRYIQLVNYCSGLCMPEIAAMGAQERLDMMLNDAMYGILFRDINMKRTFVDQDFSRLLNAYAGIIINTGEDNYLTTADAIEEGHTVMASQFINEELADRAGLAPWQMGLGHAFEIDPDIEDGFLLELAQAQLTRQVFKDATLKYMPPTKFMTGDIFKGHLMDGMFNLASIMTGQNIQLLGMLTEAIHTPYLHDRALSLDNAKYIFNNARHLMDEISYKDNGKIQKRADEILEQTTDMLEEIADKGLMKAIEEGKFAGISRPQTGGKGADGVVTKEQGYYNPFLDLLRKGLGINETG